MRLTKWIKKWLYKLLKIRTCPYCGYVITSSDCDCNCGVPVIKKSLGDK